MRERIAKAKADTKAEQERCWAAGARLAAIVWKNGYPANAGHPYLNAKAIPATALRQTKDNRLIVPVLNEVGKIQSLQFILPEKLENGTDKLFLKGGKTGGRYCPLAAFSAGNLPQMTMDQAKFRCSFSTIKKNLTLSNEIREIWLYKL